MIYLLLAILILTIANVIKTYRLSLFIERYERPNIDILNRALAISNVINFIIPFRLGYIYRIIHSSKNTKYGKSFLFATIIVEIVIDFICVSLIYLIFLIIENASINTMVFYLCCLAIVFLVTILLIVFKKYVKKIIYELAQLFNDSIELKLLKSSWFTILSFKNILKKMNIIKLIVYSILIWCLNIGSCVLLSYSLKSNTIVLDIFNSFYSDIGMTSSILLNSIHTYNTSQLVMIISYFIGSSLLLFIVSFLLKNTIKGKNSYNELLPHANLNDRLKFIKMYFNNEDNSKYFKEYLSLNNDIAIIEDYSAGSNATTMLCSKEGKLFYRKYSFGEDAKKLNDQISWIHNHEKKLTLTKIVREYYKENVCSYDMPYVKDAVTCFNYVHTSTYRDAWTTIKNALEDIDKNLHSLNSRKADKKTIDKYIDSKVLNNIAKIEKGQYIKPLIKEKYIIINGKKYHNLEYFKKYLNKEYLYEIFKNDRYSDIHGDFTIENIICIKNSKSKKNYYIIDPNTGNVHDSPYLDYAKLLQSIHGGYEFLMNTKNVSYSDNSINFLFTKSSTYYKLFDDLKKYLEEKFGKESLKSIFYHEAIHWLRLMPYKIEKNGERSLLFYAGLIMVLNDVEEMFEK